MGGGQGRASRVFKAAQWVGRRVGAALMGAASIRTLRPRARHALAGLLAVVGCAAAAPPALAVFPFYGDGTAEHPSTWKLKPGETVANLGEELTPPFAPVPAPPPPQPV